jgi:hypothetical protein
MVMIEQIESERVEDKGIGIGLSCSCVVGIVNAILGLASTSNPVRLVSSDIDGRQNIDKIILEMAKRDGCDLSACQLVSQYRKNPTLNTSGNLWSTVPVNNKCVSDMGNLTTLTLQLSSIFSGDCDVIHQQLVFILTKLSESNLFTVRFIATLVCVSLMHRLDEGSSPAVDLQSIVENRTRDTNPLIRQLASIDGLLGNWADMEILRGLTLDPDVRVREACLAHIELHGVPECAPATSVHYITSWLIKTCFGSPNVASKALGILTKYEFDISDDNVQCLANLIWVPSVASSRKTHKRQRITSALSLSALMFIDKHIMGSPGLLGDSGPSIQKMLMLVEFIDQYSDGYVYPLTGRFVRALFGYFKGRRNFLTDPALFTVCLIKCTAQPGSSDSAPIDPEIASRRINGFLEIFAAAYKESASDWKKSFKNNDGLIDTLMDILDRTDHRVEMCGRRQNHDIIAEFAKLIIRGDPAFERIVGRDPSENVRNVHELLQTIKEHTDN